MKNVSLMLGGMVVLSGKVAESAMTGHHKTKIYNLIKPL